MQNPTRRSTAFLLAQVGAHAAARFAQRLASTGLTPPDAGILWAIARTPGISQQALASALGMLPSSLVTYIDALEKRGLIERTDNPEDRRLYALLLTAKGSKFMTELGRIAKAHDEAICETLSKPERELLWALLGRIAAQQGLTPGVHPGFARLGPKRRQRRVRERDGARRPEDPAQNRR